MPTASRPRVALVQLPTSDSARLLHEILIDGRFEIILERRKYAQAGRSTTHHNWKVREVERILEDLENSMEDVGMSLVEPQ